MRKTGHDSEIKIRWRAKLKVTQVPAHWSFWLIAKKPRDRKSLKIWKKPNVMFRRVLIYLNLMNKNYSRKILNRQFKTWHRYKFNYRIISWRSSFITGIINFYTVTFTTILKSVNRKSTRHFSTFLWKYLFYFFFSFLCFLRFSGFLYSSFSLEGSTNLDAVMTERFCPRAQMTHHESENWEYKKFRIFAFKYLNFLLLFNILTPHYRDFKFSKLIN